MRQRKVSLEDSCVVIFRGSGGDTNFSRAAENKLQGRRAEVEGESTHDLTPRGRIKTLYRERKHLEYIEINGNKKY